MVPTRDTGVKEMATLPKYFSPDFEGGMYYQKGDRVSATITVRGTVIKYYFNDGSRPYREEIDMGTQSKAIQAASKMGALMRKSDGVPHMGTFRALFR